MSVIRAEYDKLFHEMSHDVQTLHDHVSVLEALFETVEAASQNSQQIQDQSGIQTTLDAVRKENQHTSCCR